ncbi:MAG: hypothetical protein MN733_30215 [Nitrososphaera sp.]|nr:hypothetical protein [Nitrososphaera sp.]
MTPIEDLSALEKLALAEAYKEVEINLYNHDGNIFAIIGTMRKALRRAGASHKEIAHD